MLKMDGQALFGPEGRRPAWPLDQKGALLPGLLEPQLRRLAGLGQAVEIGMTDLETRQGIGLDERKSWARHRDVAPGPSADHRPGKLALAAAEISLQENDIPGRQQSRKPPAEGAGRLEIGEGERALDPSRSGESVSNGNARP